MVIVVKLNDFIVFVQINKYAQNASDENSFNG